MARPRIRDFLWLIVGAAFFLVLIVGVARFNQYGKAVARASFQTERLDLIRRTRLALATASEAEKSAVLAVSDEDSQGFADQARAATTQAERLRREVQRLLSQGGTAHEADLFAQFSEMFTEFQRIDGELLALTVKNTNMKAYSLAFGPAAQLIDDMNAPLSNIAAKSANWPESRNVALLALGAQNAALSIQVLLAPHIAEESDKRMDEFEARMNEQALVARKDLDELAAVPKLSGDPDLAKATSAYGKFNAVKTQVLSLSRENTNVRSLTISLTQKRRVMLLCQETLARLEQAIIEEPKSGVPQSPR